MSDSSFQKFIKGTAELCDLLLRSKSIIAAVSIGVTGALYYWEQLSAYRAYAIYVVALASVLLAISVTWVVGNFLHRKRDRAIADAFFKLEEPLQPFEAEAMRLLRLLAMRDGSTRVSVNVDKLVACHLSYLKGVCDTATIVLAAKRSRKGPFRANIKRIDFGREAGRVHCTYKPMVRSSNFDQRRKDYDDALESGTLYGRIGPLHLADNYVYDQIFNDRYKDDFLVHNDIRKLLKEVKKTDKNYLEPNDESLSLYKSFIVVPIFGIIPPMAEDRSSKGAAGKYLQSKGKNVFGLMCVDSATKNSFNREYDLSVTRQLAAYAFWSFRMVLAVRDLAQRKNVALIQSESIDES